MLEVLHLILRDRFLCNYAFADPKYFFCVYSIIVCFWLQRFFFSCCDYLCMIRVVDVIIHRLLNCITSSEEISEDCIKYMLQVLFSLMSTGHSFILYIKSSDESGMEKCPLFCQKNIVVATQQQYNPYPVIKRFLCFPFYILSIWWCNPIRSKNGKSDWQSYWIGPRATKSLGFL